MRFHREAWRFGAIGLVIALVPIVFAWPWGLLALLLPAGVMLFFRDPERAAPAEADAIISPADGLILRTGPGTPPAELGLGAGPFTQISIFLSIFDVHVVRAPAAGRIHAVVHNPGKFLVASLDKASTDNERLSLVLEREGRPAMVVVFVAGLIARRILCAVKPDQRVLAGERCGLIRFGSRADLYLPTDLAPAVTKGDRVRAGETVLARAA